MQFFRALLAVQSGKAGTHGVETDYYGSNYASTYDTMCITWE